MTAQIKVPTLSHFDFTALPSIRVMESFVALGQVFAGVQNGIWPYDEYYWSERKGAWGGVEMPARETVVNLGLYGASLESYMNNGFDEPLLRVASGAVLLGQGQIIYKSNLKYAPIPDSPTAFRLYSCATGSLTSQADISGALGTVPNGSYILWARVFAGEYFQTGHGMAYQKDGEWSAVRVVVGPGPWLLAPGVLPSPGAALYSKANNAELVLTADNEASARVLFDPLARAVSASCILDQDIKRRDGSTLLAKGSVLIGGLRTSRSGPQTALWKLGANGTAQIFGLQDSFSNGMCECGKTNHHASDLVQAPDGTLWLLTECALFKFDPDADVFDALPGWPVHNDGEEDGHPGGNCLRFPSRSEMVHWTEDLTGRDKTDDLFYNRIVRRINGRDVLGPSTLWHGTNCAEMYLGRMWAVRGVRDIVPTQDEPNPPLTGSLYLDWFDGGQWHGYEGMKRDMSATFWQRLRRVGDTLFLFGFKPGAPLGVSTGHLDGTPMVDDEGKPLESAPTTAAGSQALLDTPTCAIADGSYLRDAQFDYFIRRATVLADERLMLTARAGNAGIGPANRVVEILTGDGGNTKICSFWNEDDGAFEMGLLDFQQLGGDVTKIPAFFTWLPLTDVNAGGKWMVATTAPSSGYYLQTQMTATAIKFVAHPNGTLPYSSDVWNRLCFAILSDGSLDTEDDGPNAGGPTIEPTATNAQEALDSMPAGTKFRVIERPVAEGAMPLSAFQVNDPSDDRRLSVSRDLYPSLYVKAMENGAPADLTTYTQLVNYTRLEILKKTTSTGIYVVVLVPQSVPPLRADELPHIQRRA